MQSFLSVLVIVGALFVFAGNGADGTAKKIYYLIAISLWMLAAFLAYIFYFGFTVPDTIRAGVVVELFGLECARLVVDTSSTELLAHQNSPSNLHLKVTIPCNFRRGNLGYQPIM